MWVESVLSDTMSLGRKSLSFILTWNNGSELVHIAVNQAILQRAPSHSRNSNEDQGFPAEGRHPGDLLIKQQFRLIELTVSHRTVHGLALSFRDLLGNNIIFKLIIFKNFIKELTLVPQMPIL